jgi:hypothetical protein
MSDTLTQLGSPDQLPDIASFVAYHVERLKGLPPDHLESEVKGLLTTWYHSYLDSVNIKQEPDDHVADDQKRRIRKDLEYKYFKSSAYKVQVERDKMHTTVLQLQHKLNDLQQQLPVMTDIIRSKQAEDD